jgi:glycosyltransferase involved in cell wall biosynthesis
MEKYIYRNATVILGQSNEIISHIHELYHSKKCYLYRNFPEHSVAEAPSVFNESGKVKMFYAGLLGVAQGVLSICEKMDLQHLNIEFHIFGDGAEKTSILKYLKEHPEKNIHFHGMVERAELRNWLKQFHVALVPLHTRIFGSVPSKIFEYSTLGIPILYFGGGEGEDIVRENDLGWVAEVADFNELNNCLKIISNLGSREIAALQPNVFQVAKNKFNLDEQMRELLTKDVF